MSPIRCPPLEWALLLLLGLGAGCGPAEPTGRYGVVQRDFTWTSVAPSAPGTRAPLSRNWTFDAPQPEWIVTAGTATPGAAALLLDGRGQVGLEGPGRRIIDDEVVHWLSVRLATTTAHDLQVSWRGGAPRSIALQATGEVETVTIALDSAKSVLTSEDAPDLRLTAVGAADAPVQVRLERIGLVSDYESAGGQGFIPAKLVRAGVRRQGIALRAPGGVVLHVPAERGDRLRFALAVVGGDQPLDVVLAEASGRIPEQRFACTPGGPWSEHALPLAESPPDGGWELTFRAAAPADSTAVVLIGSPLLLRRSTSQPANLVLYVEDTLRADHLQTLGYPRPTDPHLVQVAAAGATFTRVWSSTNWTRPAVSSLLTGLDAVGHANRAIEWCVADGIVTLPEALADAGWVTASFVTNEHGGSWSGLDQGFDAQGDPAAFGSDAVTSTLTSSVIREPIARFLTEHADESLFVYAHSLDPHAPYEPDDQSLRDLAAAGIPPDVPAGSSDVVSRIAASVPQYDAEIRHNDTELGHLDATLAALGLADDTLVVFVADHGEAFFDHGQWEHRHSLHEEEVRVPWVLRWPARLPAGRRIDFPASLVDVAPTVLGLLGVRIPADWRGRDLSALCLDSRARLPDSPLFIDTLDVPPSATRVGEVALVAWPDKLTADVAGDGTLTPSLLYKLDTDPQERQNLLPLGGAEHPRVRAMLDELRLRLEAGPVFSAGAARAADVSPQLEAWMRQMGYLR